MEFLPTGYLRNKYSELYGYTTPSGIVLIKKNEKFPRLTEEEERFHATLLCSTTYGLLHTIFDSFDYDLEAFESKLDFYWREKNNKEGENPTIGIYGSDSGTLIIQNANSMEKESLDYKINREIRTLMKQHVDNMYENSTLAHEVVAKYISFRYASSYYPYHIFELNKELDSQKSVLPELEYVCELLGHPLESSDWFAATFMLLLGAISLSTGELDKLSNLQSRKKTRKALLSNKFWDSKTPNERFEFLLRNTPSAKIVEWHRQYQVLAEFETPFYNQLYLGEITSFFENLLYSQKIKIDYDPDRIELIKKAVLLTANIKNACLALNTTFIIDRHGSVIQSPDGEIEGIWMGGFRFNDPFFAHPAGVVFREPKFCEDNTVVDLELNEFISLQKNEKPDYIILVPIPQKDQNNPIIVYAYPRVNTYGGEQQTSKLNSVPSIIRTKLKPSNAHLIEKKLSKSKIIWLFRIIPEGQWTDYKASTKDIYKGKGDIVFLDLVNEYSKNLNVSHTMFYKGKLSSTSRDYIDSSTQTYLGMIKVNKESEYIEIASVPFYVKEILENYHEEHERRRTPKKERDYDVEFPPHDNARFEIGIIAFEVAYLYDLLPRQLFERYTQEELWKTTERIFGY